MAKKKVKREKHLDRVRSQELRRARLERYQRDPDKIGRGRDHWRPHLRVYMGSPGENPTYEDWLMVNFARRGLAGNDLTRALLPATGPMIDAWIHNNRWICKCECGGQETIDPEDLRFFCMSCFNFLAKGRSRKIKLPAQWKKVEAVMLARPDPLTRCMAYGMDLETLAWKCLETLADLEQENQSHGLPLQAERVRGRGR